MELPGRCGTGPEDYRYGYNGMEKDSEVSGDGNSYTTQFRQYDPRLGRWKSIDPLSAMFPNESPYVGFGNNPVYFVDPLGLKKDPGQKEKRKEKRQQNKLDRAKNRATEYADEHGIDDYDVSIAASGNVWMTWGKDDGARAHLILGSERKGRRWAEKQTKNRRKAYMAKFGSISDGIDPRDKDGSVRITHGKIDGPVLNELLEADIPLSIEPYTGNVIDWFDRLDGGRGEFEHDGRSFYYDDDGSIAGGGFMPEGGNGPFEYIGPAGGGKWIYGAFKSRSKWVSQFAKRGWTEKMVTEAIISGKSFEAVNMVYKGHSATRYVHPITGQSVVIDNVTLELLHVGGPGFKY